MPHGIEQQLKEHLAKRPERPTPIPESITDPRWIAWRKVYDPWVDKKNQLEFLRDHR
jgi:hypothetical protein